MVTLGAATIMNSEKQQNVMQVGCNSPIRLPKNDLYDYTNKSPGSKKEGLTPSSLGRIL